MREHLCVSNLSYWKIICLFIRPLLALHVIAWLGDGGNFRRKRYCSWLRSSWFRKESTERQGHWVQCDRGWHSEHLKESSPHARDLLVWSSPIHLKFKGLLPSARHCLGGSQKQCPRHTAATLLHRKTVLLTTWTGQNFCSLVHSSIHSFNCTYWALWEQGE